MKKTIKRETADSIYKLLDKAKSVKDSAARRTVFKVMYPMKKVAGECDDYKSEAAKRLQPENYEEIAGIITEFNNMSPSEREDALKKPKFVDALKSNFAFNQELTKCVSEYMGEECEIEFEPLTDSAFDALCDANPEWTLGECIGLQEALCAKEGEGA